MNAQANNSARSHPRKWLVLALVTTGTFAGTLDISIIDVALPTLTSVFNTTITVSQWFLLAYALTNTFLLPAAGKSSDLYGRRRVYIAGLLIFALGSLLSGLAMSARMLIATRAFQGIGSAVLIAVGPALIMHAFPESQRGKSLGVIGVGVGLGMLAGPIVGGMLVHYAGWRWIFFVNVPIAVGAAFVMWRTVAGLNDTAHGRIDKIGTVLLSATLTAALLALTHGQRHGWTSTITLTLFGVGAISLVALLFAETRLSDPLLDLSLFRKRNFAVGMLSASTNYAAMIPTAVFMPFYVQNVLGYDPDRVGLVLASGPVALAIVAPFAGALSDRIGSRFLTTTGLVVTGVATLLMRTLTTDSAWWEVVWRLAFVSVGSGLFVSPNARSVLSSVTRDRVGEAAGVLSLMRDVGIVLGAGLAAAIIISISPGFSLSDAAVRMPSTARQALLTGLQAAFLAAAAIAFLGAAISAFRTAR